MKSTYSICSNCLKVNRISENKLTSENPACGSCHQPLELHAGITDLNEKTFQPFLDKSPLPIVIDFWASWCGPCRSFEPIFKDAAREFLDQFIFTKLNIEKNQRTASRLHVRGVPTLIVFEDGKEKDRQSGALPPMELRHWLNSQKTKRSA
jgi:thioredoxin 2